MTKKGLIKLATQPHLFARDYIKKKHINLPIPSFGGTVNGEYRYTIVSAVYNVAPYLDDYFKSLVNQSLDFKKHIFLILVDDGSPDGSAQIIKKWQKKYPNNITYVKKENGGQASARNVGLAYVNTEWVTFIDPDDFVNKVYFEEIDGFLGRNKNKKLSLISCNFIFYYEDKNKYLDTHPLKYRFHNKEKVVSVNDMSGQIQISVNSAFFRTSIIKTNQVLFNENIRPSLEDGEFTMRYLLDVPLSSLVAFLKKPKYLYRKREAGDSTLDTGWLNPKGFDDVLQLACIDLFKLSLKKRGYVPKEQQKMVLYHLIWQFKRIINNPSSISFLDEKQILRYKKLLKEIFVYIDIEEIDKFNLAGAWFYHKVGLLGMMKKHEPSYQIAYIEDYDSAKDEVLIKYFSYFDKNIVCTVDNKEILPSYNKIKRNDFLGDLFVNEYLLWIPLNRGYFIDIFIDNKDTRIGFKGKHWFNGVETSLIRMYFQNQILDDAEFPLSIKLKRTIYQSSYFRKKFDKAWLLMDRDTQADDNAEHFYKYIISNYPNINIYFVLRKTSHDWKRLNNEGFNLIEFASFEYEALLCNAIHLISSHVDSYVINYLPNRYFKDLIQYKYTFLQHGVTQNDISSWLNSKKIDNLITVSKREYKSIINNHTKYKFSEKEVNLLGFPRHDSLLSNDVIKEKIILIMPTWRESLVGNTVGKGNKREKIKDFSNTTYYKHWRSLLHSKELQILVNSYNYKVIFFPHANIYPYLDEFKIPSYIETLSHNNGTIQTLFKKSSLMITDYSSVAYEIATLYKEVIYYQFDYEELYGGGHFVEKGYFDYKMDGFGPVCDNENDVIFELENLLKNDANPRDKYLERMKDFFAYHDTNNCKRVFGVIENLYDTKKDEISDELLLEKAKDAEEKKLCKAIEGRYELLLEREIAPKNTLFLLSRAKYSLGKIEESEILLEKYIELVGKTDEVKELIKEINSTKKLLSTLDKGDLALLVNDKTDFFSTLRFYNIKKIFEEKRWNLLSVACKILDIKKVDEENKSELYYMWGRSLRLLEDKQKAIEILAKSLSYNNIAPNASLWEYASTLYELHNEEDIDKDLILKEFEDNGYIVENIDYKLIEIWFSKKHYRQVSVAFELIDIEIIETENIDRFYYMWGKTLFEVGRYKDSIEKFKYSNNKSMEVALFNAKSMIYIENWEESYALWLAIYKKYPTYNSAEVLKNIIWALKHLDREDELQEYKNRFLKWKFLNSSDSDIEILNII